MAGITDFTLRTLSDSINRKLLPIKGHFLFFNAGTSPLVPYLSTYARQLGFSSNVVGLIYTVLPLCGLLAKPLFGIIADRYKAQKLIFLLFQIITIISLLGLYFVPGQVKLNVELDCNDGVTLLRSCYNKKGSVDSCKVDALRASNETSDCKMNCNMDSPKMWQTVCEHWHVPQYCYSHTDKLEYSAYINKVLVDSNCTFVTTHNVTLDGYNYKPGCRTGGGYVKVEEPCTMWCEDHKLGSIINDEPTNMTCVTNNLNFKLCNNRTRLFMDLHDAIEEFFTTSEGKCQVKCRLNKNNPWELMEICEGWGADVSDTCHPKTTANEHFPKNLSFTGTINLGSALSEEECFFVTLQTIMMPSGIGIPLRPLCRSKTQYQLDYQLFHTKCEIECENKKVNELLLEAQQSRTEDNPKYTKQFWLFFMLMITSWVGQAVVVTFADAICLNLLGSQVSLYGRQRLWGSVGWGVFSLLTGLLIDTFSNGAYKDYTVAFIFMTVFMLGDVAVSCFLKVDTTNMSTNILTDVLKLVLSLPTAIFLVWTIATGICTGLVWQFLFWLLEDIAKLTCDGTDYVKTLQGLVSAIQTFGGEVPFLFVSGYILKRIGHIHVMSLILLTFGIRFILYAQLTNAWWALPIEVFQGLTIGMFYPTMASYASLVSPAGTETTIQGLVGAVFEGIGTALGSFIGGRLYGEYGGSTTFLWFGYFAVTCAVVHAAVQYLIRYQATDGQTQDYASIVRFEQHGPMDTIRILEE